MGLCPSAKRTRPLTREEVPVHHSPRLASRQTLTKTRRARRPHKALNTRPLASSRLQPWAAHDHNLPLSLPMRPLSVGSLSLAAAAARVRHATAAPPSLHSSLIACQPVFAASSR